MRILILSSILHDPKTGGWGRYSYEAAHALKQEGHEVVVLCMEKNLQITHIEQIDILPSSLQLKRVYFLSWLYLIRVWWRLRKHNQFDIIHTMVEPYAFITYLLAKSMRIPYVLTVHGSQGILMLYSRIFRPFQLLAYKNASTIMTVSRYTQTQLAEWLISKQVEVIPTGVATDKFISNPSSVHHKYQLISVGALKERKGYHLALEAFSKVYREYSTSRYIIVGDQSDKVYFARLNEIIKLHGLQNVVTFYENISDLELAKLYDESYAFILISQSKKTSFEGFGVVFLEANLHGLPAIGARDCGAEDAIVDGKTGLLVSQKNSDEIAVAIKKLFENEKLYNQMRTKTKLWAQKFDWFLVIKEFIKVYKKHVHSS